MSALLVKVKRHFLFNRN